MTSTRERQQRAAARARLAREMAERQAAAKRRRQRMAGVGAAAALLLVVGGVAWAVVAISGDEETPPPAAEPSPSAAEPGACEWLPDNAEVNPNLTEVGTPPPGEPRSGVSTISITTNLGLIEVEMDRALVPCTAASFTYLSEAGFYDDTTCHRLTTQGIYVLQCGDPTATGAGGPTYKYAEENLPTGNPATYAEGMVAMAKTQRPATTGSQFFIVYQDSQLPPDYTVVGTVTEGLDIVQSVAADGAVDEEGNPIPDGAPATEVRIETLRVSEPVAVPSTPSVQPSA